MAEPGFDFDDNAMDVLIDKAKATALLREYADAAVYRARRATPVKTGRHRDAVFSSVGMENGRPVAYVGSNAPTWHIVQEYGSADTPPRRIFKNALKDSGLRFEEG